MKKEMKKSTVKFLAATLSAFTIAGTAVAFSTPTKVYAAETGADYEVYANRGRHFTGFVGKYNGVIGQEYYIVERVNNSAYTLNRHSYRGILLDTWEQPDIYIFGNFTKRMHRFYVYDEFGSISLPYEMDFCGDNYDLFTTMTIE